MRHSSVTLELLCYVVGVDLVPVPKYCESSILHNKYVCECYCHCINITTIMCECCCHVHV